jgi:hypothetical protein
VGKKIIETQGFKSLFTGIPQRCLGVVPSNIIIYASNDLSRHYLNNHFPGLSYDNNLILSGAISAVVGLSASVPLEFMKTRA